MDETSVTLVRTIKASAHEVFAAWTDPKQLMRWMAPAPYTMTVAETDPRVSGRFRMAVVGPDGEEHVTTGEYRELVPGKRLAMTWLDEGPDPTAERTETLVSVGFHEVAPGVTEVVVCHERILTPEGREGMREGWTACLDELEALFTVRVTRRFRVPAERVFEAWLDPAQAGKFLFATPTGRMLRAEIDPRVGGRFVFTDRRDGVDVEHIGEYLEIDRPRRLVFRFSVERSDWSRVAIDLVPHGTECELTLTHEIDPKWTEQATRGWNMILDGLAATIA